MQIMDFTSANCKNCYKCIQNCQVKAIKLVDNQATIIRDKCIACGQCFVVCPQNARNVVSDLDLVTSLPKGRPMVASVAPSYLALYDDPHELILQLKAMGFDYIHETAQAATMVSELYASYMTEHTRDNYITSCCPAITTMIEAYYPDLLEYLLPIESPMAIHGKSLRKLYGDEAFIVFIGPCIAKKKEALFYKEQGSIDAVLTFEELSTLTSYQWDLDRSIVTSNEPLTIGQQYPFEGGIAVGLQDCINGLGYETLNVSGLQGCQTVFDSLREGRIKRAFIEANGCLGSCIGGPALPHCTKESNIYERKLLMKRRHTPSTHIEVNDNLAKLCDEYHRPFVDRRIESIEISQELIDETLQSIGKHSVADHLNCGACGYNTCIEYARAICQGKSHPEMCIHNMRERAESLTNTVFEHSPNIIFVLDKDLNLVHLNPAGERIFLTSSKNMRGKPIHTLLNDEDFRNVQLTKTNIIGKKVKYLKYGFICIENIIYLEEQNCYIAILHNLTEQVKKDKELTMLKQNTLEAAQNVIEKQMRVAQEIAGLLGETTAETKITLMKLQQIVIGEEGELK